MPLPAVVLILVSSVAAQGVDQGVDQSVDWPAVWTELDRLEAGAPAPESWSALAREHATRFEGKLLAAYVDDAAPLRSEDLPDRFRPLEAWLAARVLEPGVARADAFRLALEEASDEVYWPRVLAAHAAFLDDVEVLRLDAAEVLALALHARVHQVWSAMTLAMLSTRLGNYERADRVLADHLAGELSGGERLALLGQRAISTMGAGDIERARDHLGRAICLGGRDGYQILALLELSRGQRNRARKLFGHLLLPRSEEIPGQGTGEDRLEDVPWALRGWGLALLPPSSEPVAPSPVTQMPEGPPAAAGRNPESPADY